MTIPLVDLKAQYHSIQDEIDAAIRRVIDNTAFIMGREVAAFEEAFADYCGVRHAVGVSSGTGALFLTLLGYGIGPGDEVITTPFTFFATGEAISQVGARPVFVDIDPVTYNIDPARIEAAITPHTRAIMPVHLYGQPAAMEEINEIARRHDLLVIEDAAQAHGSLYRGRRAGSLGHAACFSFYPSKNLGCYGDGGAVVTDDDELADRVRRLRDHGRINKYEHGELGYGHRLDGMQAAILSAKLPHLDEWNEGRRDRAARYARLLADMPVVTPEHLPDTTPVYHCYVVRVPDRDRVLQALKEAGIGAGVHYPIPLHLQPAYRFLELEEGSFPVAERMAREVISLPMYAELSDEQQDEVVAAIQAALEQTAVA
ncbi:MAG: DegT/DnrJ/EryC1/StrS family aminotransferase [Caldilineae bacterium]|nr:MAG: DegT/DnrJ/EryC1/StrS family aminotransferase [Caldilineae bacterium]